MGKLFETEAEFRIQHLDKKNDFIQNYFNVLIFLFRMEVHLTLHCSNTPITKSKMSVIKWKVLMLPMLLRQNRLSRQLKKRWLAKLRLILRKKKKSTPNFLEKCQVIQINQWMILEIYYRPLESKDKRNRSN